MGAATDLAGFVLGDFVLCVWDPENGQRELLFQKIGIKGHRDSATGSTPCLTLGMKAVGSED